MNLSEKITQSIISDIKQRLFEESFPRIIQCLNQLDEDQIWLRKNQCSNSVGNLVLHLCGNIRQYIISGIGGRNDIRQRDLEFSTVGPLEKKILIKKLSQLELEVLEVLNRILPSDLILVKKVQGFSLNVCSILIHVTEHLSYHTGQIAFFTKQENNVDLKFYGDLDLNITD